VEAYAKRQSHAIIPVTLLEYLSLCNVSGIDLLALSWCADEIDVDICPVLA
jgi:hypothetical protein